jgi:MFS family permease
MTVSDSTRLALFVGGVALAESAFYAVVPPLVPGFVRDVHMTTTEVGVLVAAYPAGVMFAAIPSMALVDWRGVRTGTIVGLALLFFSTLAFGWSTTPILLDLARLVQGVGGAMAWTGALAWLTVQSPLSKRASVIGGTLGAASIGMFIGPGIGALASQAGRGVVFSAIAVGLAALAATAPSKSPRSAPARSSLSSIWRLARHRQAGLGIGLLAGIGVVTGSVASLLPLLALRLQGTATVIGAILAVGYLLSSLLQVVAGRTADRFGRLVPTLCGFAVGAVLLPSLPVWGGIAALSVTSVVAIASISSLWTPTAAMVTDGAEHEASSQAVAVAMLNAAWAAGAALGAVVNSRIAEAAGFQLPFALLGVLCATSAVILLLRYRGRAAGQVAAERPGSAF